MSIASMFSILFGAIAFVTMISILVAAHEYGHYFFARLFGMGAEEFAIGMGKKLAIWKRVKYDIPVARDYVPDSATESKGFSFEGGGAPAKSELVETQTGKVLREETEFTVRMLPIGGFVRIKGMVPQDDGSEVRIQGGFYSKPPWQRLIVLIAGPVASVLAGVFGLVILFMTAGMPQYIKEPIIGTVATDGPAAKAGLQAGDRIVAVNGEPINKFYDFVKKVNNGAGTALSVEVARGNEHPTLKITPEEAVGPTLLPDLTSDPTPVKRGIIGISPKRGTVVLGFSDALREAVNMPIEAIKGLVRVISHPSTLKDEAGGAITMAVATNEAVQEGFGQYVGLACMISISLGIFNLLPIPPLDGGQMVMAFAELLRGGRRLSMRVQQTLMNAGVMLVLTLAVVVLFIDIQRFAGGKPKPTKPAKEMSGPAIPSQK